MCVYTWVHQLCNVDATRCMCALFFRSTYSIHSHMHIYTTAAYVCVILCVERVCWGKTWLRYATISSVSCSTVTSLVRSIELMSSFISHTVFSLSLSLSLWYHCILFSGDFITKRIHHRKDKRNKTKKSYFIHAKSWQHRNNRIFSVFFSCVSSTISCDAVLIISFHFSSVSV